ncbi:Mpv17-like protein 2, partial [Stegodyphus mimosarum]
MKFLTRVKYVSDYFFKKHLLLTNTGIGVMFLGAGDAIQQNIEKKLYHGKVYDTRRTGNMMFAGSAFGILGHYWYKFLDFKFPGASAKAVGKKILSEMAIGPPLFLGFFISIGLLEGKSVVQSFQQFKKNFFLILAIGQYMLLCKQ